ncbi:antibiotic biosynthesis monooxygenase family protein [Spirillospora sp. CA-294931]|uniref:antibiotic biosynthesis monooxygenase family protein n=1 Tax=Spirillospora sp. CA-294931 TaxID=3240042 RepID=UPI003D8C6D58
MSISRTAVTATTPIRVIVYLREPEGERGAVDAAYARARELLDGTPGLLGDLLLRSVTDPRSLTLVMEWETRRAYSAWERLHRERGHRSPMRAYQDRDRPGGHYEVYAVAGGRVY